ncbi:MAG: peptide deformylase [Verrucomicrobiales bacterium]|jgi:peptide deformylase
MVRDIVIYGNPVLREKCKPVTEITDEIRGLVEDMLDTMVAANGVGLAAPQVGIPIRLAVVDVSFDPECVSYFKVNGEDAVMEDWMPLIFMNPVLKLQGDREDDTEGCLSFPEMRADVRRPSEIKASLSIVDGEEIVIETDGLLARAIQHETDHLNGVLFVDRISTAEKIGLKRRIRLMQEEFGEFFRPDPDAEE